MNDYGSKNQRIDVIGNGSQIGRPDYSSQRRPARQFAQEEYPSRDQHISSTVRSHYYNQNSNGRPSNIQYSSIRLADNQYSNTRSSNNQYSNDRPSYNQYSNTRSSNNQYSNDRPSYNHYSNTRSSNNQYSNARLSNEQYSNIRPSYSQYSNDLYTTNNSRANTNNRPASRRTREEYDYLPSRSNDYANDDRRKKYSNIGHANVNAGYESVQGRARKREKDFDDFNFNLYDDDFNKATSRHSKSSQASFDVNDFDDFDSDDLFDSFDIDEYEEYSRLEYENEREIERNNRRKRKPVDRKPKKSDIIFLVLACLEAALSIFLIALIAIVNILPTLWFIIAIVLLLLIAIGLILTQIRKVNRNKKLKIAGRIIAIFMCIVIIFLSYFVSLAGRAINAVSKDTGYVINQVHVAVLASDNATSIKDLKDETFGTIPSFKPLILNEAMNDFENQAGCTIKTKEYTNAIDLIESLYSKESRVIIFNNDMFGDMREKHADVDNEIKIIYTFKSKTEINIQSNTDVDVTQEPFLFFISGNDEFGELSLGGRSDVNMLVSVNPVSHEVLLISIPRDYYVEFPEVSGTARDKITHAGIYGIDTQLATLAELYGYDVDFYSYVNFSSFIDIVDAVGGVVVENEMEFTSIGGVYFPAGQVTLDGLIALDFVREREAFEDGDFMRGRHQQQVIEAIIHKLLSSTSLTVYSQLVNTLERVCVTNIPKESISALIKKQLAEGGTWHISKVQAEGVPMMQPSYASGGIALSVVMPYSGSIQLIKDTMGQLFSGQPVEARQMNETDDYSYVITPLPVPDEEDDEDKDKDKDKDKKKKDGDQEESEDETEEESEEETENTEDG